ncbi:CHAP domain-containing protein [Roseomonas xinghualingensis]|uniref:CHAP domain-containing protein n=1 Tax=Roseomonas xinghualingensis TaxID=2986475 RepID=UPI0021F149FF|nr:CHAP domain-containing protein [Roseomonas sp. SXEYE001]MCV4206114.1 CHAP domain-containing protein [Roseomonas sp. SXEYE001]
MILRLALLALSGAALSACGSTRGPIAAGYGYEASAGYQSCVPYARERSGIELRGDAWQWWEVAAGRYDRSVRPRPGAVLVLQRTSRLRDGHVAVVSRVVGPREIRVDHANWASGGLKGRVARDQPVIDVSARNDWSEVRVWYPPARVVGNTVFPAHGFIHPERRWASAE